MLLHDIEVSNIYHMNSLKHNLLDYTDADKFDVILMNPPYGGHEDKSIQGFFPDDLASSETADLFMSVILYRLKKNGRAAVVVPDGFLFGLDNAKVNIKKKLTGNVDLANRVQKFVDCRSKDVSRREIYIVEGDSALGACKLSRDAEFQGIMPVRGKILNCLKADYARIFKSDVITDLMRVLGCGVEVQSKQTKDLSAFNLENLRWNKVIICTDADVDGFQIRTLILTMLYRLAPTLIREGYVYIAESPLYEIVSKGKTYFAYSDREKAAIVDSLGGAKADINRSKGLGENDPEMMWLTTMNPDTRKLIRVMPEDVERTAQMFDLLLGDNLAGRKAHIAECGSQFLDLADIS